VIEVVGSKVITRRPTSINPETTSELEEDADDEAATPGARAPTEPDDVAFEPYQTPVALTPGNWKKKTRGQARVMVDVDPEETEVESSDIEIVMVERKVKKKRLATVDTVPIDVTSCIIDGLTLSNFGSRYHEPPGSRLREVRA
jgi:hypothetical protein